MQDPHIRYPQDPGPLLPYKADGGHLRFRWPRKDDPRPNLLRRRVQEGGTGVYIVRPPAALEGEESGFCVIEAYYPDQFSESYYHQLDPARRSDWQLGRLVVLNTGWWLAPKVFHERIDPFDLLVTEIRRNNRQSRQDLRRQVHETYIKDELDRRQEAREDEVLDATADRIAARGAEAITRAKFPTVSVPDTVH